MDLIHELADYGVVPTSMIDISDGLASELLHLSKNSNMGMKIYEDKLPVDKQTYDTGFELGIDSTTAVLNGGEDYELLFTIKQADHDKIKNHADIHFIGYVQDIKDGNLMITKSENVVKIEAQGWNHFNKK